MEVALDSDSQFENSELDGPGLLKKYCELCVKYSLTDMTGEL